MPYHIALLQKELEKEKQTLALMEQRLEKLQPYQDYRIKTMKHGNVIYSSVLKRRESIAVRFNSEEEKNRFLRLIRAQRFYAEGKKRAGRNIDLIEAVITGYRSLEPGDIIRDFSRAYLPVPGFCLETTTKPKDWISQPEINRLIFETAGPGAKQADATKLAKMLRSVEPAKLDALRKRIGEKRVEYLLEPYYPKALQHHAEDGTLVRSKAEVADIAVFIRLGIPYRYEEPVFANGRWYLIDFVIVLPYTNRLAYIEHAGMLEKDSYRENLSAKIGDLIKEGIVPGRDLFLTCDYPGSVTDSTLLRRKIEYILSTDEQIC